MKRETNYLKCLYLTIWSKKGWEIMMTLFSFVNFKKKCLTSNCLFPLLCLTLKNIILSLFGAWSQFDRLILRVDRSKKCYLMERWGEKEWKNSQFVSNVLSWFLSRKKYDQVSISSTFYAQIFHTNVYSLLRIWL